MSPSEEAAGPHSDLPDTSKGPEVVDDMRAGIAALQARLQSRVDAGVVGSLAGVPSEAPAQPSRSPIEEHVAELVDDMLHAVQRLRNLEAGQAKLLERLDAVERTFQQGQFGQAREIDAIRRELVGARSALAAKNAVDAIVPALERLFVMRAPLSPRKHEGLVNQIDAIVLALEGVLKSLGFVPFEPAVGAAFDPERMRSVGTAKGAPGIVLDVPQKGWLAGDVVVRPAGVLLAATARPQR